MKIEKVFSRHLTDDGKFIRKKYLLKNRVSKMNLMNMIVMKKPFILFCMIISKRLQQADYLQRILKRKLILLADWQL